MHMLLLLLLLSHAKIFCALLLCIRRRAFSAPGRIDTADVITPSAGGARPLQDAHAGEIGAGGAAWAFAAGQYASDGPRAGRRRRACVGSRLHEYVESFECMQTLTRMLPVSAVRSTQCVRRHSGSMRRIGSTAMGSHHACHPRVPLVNNSVLNSQ